MAILTLLLTSGLSGILLWAALEKARAQRNLRSTLAALGFGHGPARLLAPVVPAVELITGIGLLLAPGAGWPRLFVVGLGSTFAVAGGLALWNGRQISCSCLGSTGGGLLGWSQIILLPGWLAATYTLHQLDPDWSATRGLQYLAGLMVLLGALRAIPVVREWRTATGNRRAIDEAVVVRAPMVARVQKAATL